MSNFTVEWLQTKKDTEKRWHMPNISSFYRRYWLLKQEVVDFPTIREYISPRNDWFTIIYRTEIRQSHTVYLTFIFTKKDNYTL